MVQINLFTKQKQSHRCGKQIYSYQGQKELGREKLGDSVRFSSVAQSCPTLFNPMNHQASLSITNSQSSRRLIRVGDAIQPSHPLLSPFPPAPKPSQHQSLFP